MNAVGMRAETPFYGPRAKGQAIALARKLTAHDTEIKIIDQDGEEIEF